MCADKKPSNNNAYPATDFVDAATQRLCAMYDSVSASLWLEKPADERLLADLSHVVTSWYETGDYVIRGRLENLHVSVKPNNVFVTGSWPKFHLGDNLQVLTKQETERAIENLSDRLHLPMKEAIVTRVDIASTFAMRKPVTRYLSCLGEARYYHRATPGKGSVQYYTNGGRRTLSFYDKVSQVKQSREGTPPGIGRNLLRYELQLKKEVRKQLKHRDSITAAMLFNDLLYAQIVDRWVSEYFAIERVHRLRLGEPMMQVKQLNELLAVAGLKMLGEDGVFSLLQQNDMSRMQRYRLKGRVRELARSKTYTEPDDCLSELDSRVKEAVDLYR